MKLTNRKLKALIKDEAMATREYNALGFKSLSRDEHRHHEFLMKLKHKNK